jgi:hypothetical protein
MHPEENGNFSWLAILAGYAPQGTDKTGRPQVLNYIADRTSHYGLKRFDDYPGVFTTRELPLPKLAERRRARRFCLRLPVRCRRIDTPQPLDLIITGESLNVSSKGLLFSSSEGFLRGQIVEVSIDWPVLLENRVSLTLVVEGTVARSAGSHTAMRIDRYRFTTRSAVGVPSA